MVNEKYSEIARQSSSCRCSCGCEEPDYSFIGDKYESKEGYVAEADLGLGCGIPTDFADLKKGDNVLDLGSGAGNDCFVARAEVGVSGRVVGLDFSDDMLAQARSNVHKLGYDNVEFIKGDIEALPLADTAFDVVISNCVLNLVPDKSKAYSEIFRVLKTGGHFCNSDVVLEGDLPEQLATAAVMYAGCIAGAMQKDEYLKTIEEEGFSGVEIKKEKKITIPDNILLEFLSKEELGKFKESGVGIFSITVVGNR